MSPNESWVLPRFVLLGKLKAAEEDVVYIFQRFQDVPPVLDGQRKAEVPETPLLSRVRNVVALPTKLVVPTTPGVERLHDHVAPMKIGMNITYHPVQHRRTGKDLKKAGGPLKRSMRLPHLPHLEIRATCQLVGAVVGKGRKISPLLSNLVLALVGAMQLP